MGTYVRESHVLSKIMDRIGYSTDLIAFRQSKYRNLESSVSDKFREDQLCEIISGSKAEGLTSIMENDIDIMIVPLDVFCTEHPSLNLNSDSSSVFKLEMDHSEPGYAFLRAVQLSDSSTWLSVAGLKEISTGKCYLSNHCLSYIAREVKSYEEDYFEFLETIGVHGPAITYVCCGFLFNDNVLALRCECPVYLDAWVTRDRKYNWPPADVIREVSTMEVHVVPTGFSGSSTFFLEWRICFTRGEIRLVQSLNPSLTKVLILLKQIAKETLKPISKDITSYIMKNLVFWVAESHDYSYFTVDNLINILQLALHDLKTRIVANWLPNYMIPERNLLANKLTRKQRDQLCRKIDSLIAEGYRVVLNSAKIRNSFNMIRCSSDELRVFYGKREKIELFVLAELC